MSDPTNKQRVVFLEGGEDVDPDEEYKKLVEEATIEECALQLPRGYISVSQIDTYRMCPLRYKYRYIDGLIRPPNVNLAEGKAVHHGVATGHLELLKSGKLPVDVLLDAHSDSWKRERGDIAWEDDDDNENTILKRDRQFLVDYHKKFIPQLETQLHEGRPAVEHRFWVTMGQARVPVLGFIDLVARNSTKPSKGAEGSGEIEVIDHKVVTKMKSQSDVDSSIQLSVYAGVMKVPRVRFQCFVKTKSPYIGAVAAVHGARHWRWAEFVVQQIAQCISAGVFPPGADGWHCSEKYCGYWDICRGKG